MSDGTAVSDYTIIGFTNDGSARFRIWDQDSATGWIDLTDAILFGAWNSLAIEFTGTQYNYFVNGTLAHQDTSISGTSGFSAAIVQAYNFDNSRAGYTAYWADATSVPAGRSTSATSR